MYSAFTAAPTRLLRNRDEGFGSLNASTLRCAGEREREIGRCRCTGFATAHPVSVTGAWSSKAQDSDISDMRGRQTLPKRASRLEIEPPL
eukprot:4387532-Amphidinium_carterae.1